MSYVPRCLCLFLAAAALASPVAAFSPLVPTLFKSRTTVTTRPHFTQSRRPTLSPVVSMQASGLEGEEIRPVVQIEKGKKGHTTDCVVIGAGLGGLCAGALLVRFLFVDPTLLFCAVTSSARLPALPKGCKKAIVSTIAIESCYLWLVRKVVVLWHSESSSESSQQKTNVAHLRLPFAIISTASEEVPSCPASLSL